MQSTADLRTIAKHELLEEVVHTFGVARIKVTGDSMLPSVWPGDVITIGRRPFSELRPGHIVLCSRGEQLVAHRVVRRVGDHLITRGDSLRSNDPPFQETHVLGRVVSITRNGHDIDPRFTRARRMAAWLLRRSDVCGRVFLRWTRFGPENWPRMNADKRR